MQSETALGKPRVFAKLPYWLWEIFAGAGAFLFLTLSYILFKPLCQIDGLPNGFFPRLYGFALLFGVLLCALILQLQKKLTFERAVFLLFLAGFVIRLTYMLYTSGHTRQYDTWSTNHNGHYDYANTFYETGKLPTQSFDENSIYQFYHPPLNAFLQGMWMRVFKAICPIGSLVTGDSVDASVYGNGNLYQSCQILSAFWTYLTAFFFTKTILRTKLSNAGKLVAVAFVCLFPRLSQLSGQLNNDAISIAFSAIALYYFYRWVFEKKSWLNFLLCAVFVGISLFCKMSAASMCLGMAFVFAYQLICSIMRAVRSKKGRPLGKVESALPLATIIGQYAAFVLIAGVIGLWWQAYLMKVYGLPFNFVFRNLNSALFTGSRSWVIANRPSKLTYYDQNNSGLLYENTLVNILGRYVSPILFRDFSTTFYCQAFDNYNILSYALRCSIFGEFSYWYGVADCFAIFAIVSLYVVWFSLVIGVIACLISRTHLGKEAMVALALLVGFIVMFLYLQVSMPYGCSMDFRYIVPIILPVAIILGRLSDILSEKRASGGKAFSFLQPAFLVAVLCFLLASSGFYLSAI